MSRKISHAYVRYLDDEEKLIVKTCDVKGFNPKNIDDYDATKKYKVLWCDGLTKKSNYYNASIILLGTSKKDVELKIKQREENTKHQHSHSPKPLSSSDSEMSSIDEPQLKNQKKDDLKLRNDFHDNNGQERDTKITKAPSQTDLQKDTQNLISEQIGDLRNRMDALENDNRNLKLQMMTIKRELDSAKKELKERNDSKNEDNWIQFKNIEEKTNHYSNTEQLSESEKNIDEIFDDPIIETTSGKPGKEVQASCSTNKLLLPQCSANRYQKIMTVDTVSGKKVEKIYLDEDIIISSESWDAIKNQKDHSKFVKNFAQAIWTRHELINRSLDGSGTSRILNRSPRKKVTPKKRKLLEDCFKDRLEQQEPGLDGKLLDKTVKGSGKYLTELINDLIKREIRNSKK